MRDAGIIPARAGFTNDKWTQDLCNHGSSPLARGLLVVECQPGQVARIIPARAGFTPYGEADKCSSWDHPRSRGVYDFITVGDLNLTGSSPLARGLLPGTPGFRLVFGIIPARAGFTATLAQVEASGKDHPRSRGVYYKEKGAKKWVAGSSPLARGLLLFNAKCDLSYGIIPARAGFTHSGTVAGLEVQDHPRSRGVYRG